MKPDGDELNFCGRGSKNYKFFFNEFILWYSWYWVKFLISSKLSTLTVNDCLEIVILISDLVSVPAYLSHKVYHWHSGKCLNMMYSLQLWTSDPKILEKTQPSSSHSTTKRRSKAYSKTSAPRPTSTFIVICCYRSVLKRFLNRVTTFGAKGGSTLSLAALVNSLNKSLTMGRILQIFGYI